MSSGVAKTIARYTALGALFLVPLTPLLVANSFFFPFITGKAFFFRVAVEIAVAAWVLLAFLDRRYRPRFSWIGVTVLAFVLWMFVADLFAVNVLKAFWSNFERMEGWVTLAHLLGFFVVAGAVLRGEEKWRAWFLAALGVSLVVALYGLFQLFGWFAIHQGSTRIDSTLGNSAYFAIYLLFNAAVALWLALTERIRWLRVALVALAVFEAALIFFTETRGTILGLVGAVVLGAVLFALSGAGRARRAGASALIILVVLVGGFLFVRNSSFVHNHSTLNRLASISLADGATRFTIWRISWQGFLDRPVFGWGQEGFNYVFGRHYDPSLYRQEPWFDRAHNAFIDWAMAGGAPAFLLFLALFLVTIVTLWRAPDLSRAERVVLTGALLGYAFHNLFVFDNLVSYLYFFALLALVDSQVARPIRAFERAPEFASADAIVTALPLTGVALLAALFFVNVPGARAVGELITAINPASGDLAHHVATFEDLLKHPAFAAQEIREQLVSFASQVVAAEGIPAEDKAAFASLAVEEMQKQVAKTPLDPRAWLELAFAKRVAGDQAGALEALQAAAALTPRKQQIYIEEGDTYWQLGDTADASKAFDQAYALSPQFSELAIYVAAGDLAVGDRAGARALLTRVFGAPVVDSDALAAAYYRAKDYQDLLALWQLRASRSDASAGVRLGLAAAYALAGDRAAAVAEARAIIADHPEAASQVDQFLSQLSHIAQ